MPVVVLVVALLAADHPVAAALRDPGLFLNVDVHELAGSGSLVSDRLWPSERQPSRLVKLVQQRHRVAFRHPAPGTRHPADCRSGNAQVVTDAMRPSATGESQRGDPPFEFTRGYFANGEVAISDPSSVIPPDTWQPILSPSLASIETAPLLVGLATSLNDQLGKTKTTLGGEWGINVSHEDLRLTTCVVTHIVPEVFATSNDHNVHRNYS